MAFSAEWAGTYQAGLSALRRDSPDVALVEQNLGIHTGVELIREARAAGFATPMIMLTAGMDLALEDEASAAAPQITSRHRRSRRQP